jgi:hypothetical protein
MFPALQQNWLSDRLAEEPPIIDDWNIPFPSQQ